MTETAVDTDVVLEAVDVGKNFGVTQALAGVNFTVRRGRVTALFGENGAGKSTLMKILAGIQKPSFGQILLNGEEVDLDGPVDALERGIAIIHQELNLCPNLSIRDNIFLGRELRNRRGGIRYREEDQITTELMSLLEENLSPKTIAGELRLGQQQLVEIARALSANARILIMDEPTSALSAPEVRVLFKVIRELTAKGVAIVYISHHLEEALAIADDIVVFRDGNLVATAQAHDVDLPWLVSKMVGREAIHDFTHTERHIGDPVLSVSNISIINPDDPLRFAVSDVSLDVRAGEVVTLYGLMGAGRTELLECIAGVMPQVEGTVTVNGRSIDGLSIQERIDLGVGLVPEDRQRDGLVQMMSVGKNLTLANLLNLTKGGLLSKGEQVNEADQQIANVHIKTEGPDAPITSLSGGNQQKVVIGKMLMTNPKVLLLDEPTRGIDVGAKGEIYSLIFELAAQGLAVLVATSEVGEALTASHRIVVLSRGRISAQFDPRETTREEVMAASGEVVEETGNGDPS